MGHEASGPQVYVALCASLPPAAQIGGDKVLTSKTLSFAACLADQSNFLLPKANIWGTSAEEEVPMTVSEPQNHK